MGNDRFSSVALSGLVELPAYVIVQLVLNRSVTRGDEGGVGSRPQQVSDSGDEGGVGSRPQQVSDTRGRGWCRVSSSTDQ